MGRFRAFSYLDHFGDVNEMVLDTVPAVETGQLRLLDHAFEIAVVAYPRTSAKSRLDQNSLSHRSCA